MLDLKEKAKKYSSIKYALAILSTVYLLAILLIFTASGSSKDFTYYLANFSRHNFLIVPLYLLIIAIVYSVLNFPLDFYSSFVLEHKFSLSSQKITDWLADQCKQGLISYLISVICLEFFYFVLKYYPAGWWLMISVFWILFTLILTKIAPVVIIPLFFKYKKLQDENLRERIMHLAEKMRVKILDVFEIDFSKKSLKANAAFVGLGATKRVLLADTLKGKYSQDEIEVILAHEFAHYQLRHLLKLVLINSLIIALGFYLIYKSSFYLLGFFGFTSLADIAAMPVIFFYFVIFGLVTQPLSNSISRSLEKDADILALKTTGLKEAFISLMEKLAEQNLADRTPHPIIKFFFFDHPPINERINMAKSFS